MDKTDMTREKKKRKVTCICKKVKQKIFVYKLNKQNCQYHTTRRHRKQ